MKSGDGVSEVEKSIQCYAFPLTALCSCRFPVLWVGCYLFQLTQSFFADMSD